VYDLVPASTDERETAESVLEHIYGFDLFRDKGFLGEAWHLNAGWMEQGYTSGVSSMKFKTLAKMLSACLPKRPLVYAFVSLLR
jgi:hypothetical protein